MTEITFEQIENFCRLIDKNIERHPEGYELRVLMSPDMKRILRKKAPYFFSRFADVGGPDRFKGCRIIEVIADGYLSAAWEISEG